MCSVCPVGHLMACEFETYSKDVTQNVIGNNRAVPWIKLKPMATRSLNCVLIVVEPISQLQRTISAAASLQILAKANTIPLHQHVKALCLQGQLEEALHILQSPHSHVGLSTYSSLLQGCIKSNALSEGKLVHAHMKVSGFIADTISDNILVNMYVKCGNLMNARRVFDQMPQRDVCSWSVMIAGYAKRGLPEKALALFHQMRGTGIQPNHFTYSSVLPACASLSSLEEGVEIHRQIRNSGFECDAIVGSALIDMYAKCGNMKKAREVFDEMHQRDLFSWTSLIAGYAQIGEGEEALRLFRQIRFSSLTPDLKTLSSVLPACGILAALRQGTEIHAEIIRRGFGSALFVASALVDMYAKCGRIEKALRLFEKLEHRDVLSWTVMIAGHTQNGQADQALELFEQMQEAGVRPDSKTFSSVLPACANLAALEYGMEIHERIIQSGLQSDIGVVNALIDMYGKCGSLKKARELFDNMHKRDVVSWTSMIAGYALHGYGGEALALFEQMKPSGVNPNHITFVCVLTACCHAGLVEEGQRYFKCLSEHYQITPTTEHYSCMVDLLGRAGQLHEALDFINKLPIKPNANVWTCLLGACAIYNNIKLGECAAERLFELDPKNPAPYVLLSNIYAAAGRWGDTERIWKMMKDEGVKKTPGSSWIEVDKQVHAFLVGDKSHPQMQNIYNELERLSMEMKVDGYVPDTKFVRNDVEEEQKQQLIYHHSEKLAIVFGLLNTAPGTTIRVIKNLRMCGDCHSATKYISKIVSREIVVRDTNRYHHFKYGQCSCGDYW